MPVTQVRKTWAIKHKQHHKIIVRKKLIIIWKSVLGTSLNHLGFLPLLLRQFSSVYFLIISFMSPLRQRSLSRREKKHVLELMRTAICKKEKYQLSIFWTTAAWFWTAYGKSFCLTTALLVQDVCILNAKFQKLLVPYLNHVPQLVTGCSISLLAHEFRIQSSVFKPYADQCRNSAVLQPPQYLETYASFCLNNQQPK